MGGNFRVDEVFLDVVIDVSFFSSLLLRVIKRFFYSSSRLKLSPTSFICVAFVAFLFLLWAGSLDSDADVNARLGATAHFSLSLQK